MKNLVRDRDFYKHLAAIAIPLSLQNIISFGVQMMDTVMVGSLGDTALSAANLAGQPFFVFMVFNFGLASGGAVLIAQYWGRGDVHVCRRVLAISMRCIAITAIVFTFVCKLFPTQILSLFSREHEVIALGADYLSIVSYSYIFNGIASSYLMSIRAIENVKLSTFVYTVSFFVNVFFNYCFIFGKFGFPEMGLAGAAVGTVIARISEFIIVLIYTSFIEKKLGFKLRNLLEQERELLPDYFRHSLPVVGSELIWSLASVTQAAIIGRIGSSFVAANSIANVVQQLAMVAMFGIGNATAVIMGKTVGEGRRDYARKIGNTMTLMAFAIGLCGCAIVLSLRGVAVSIYNVTPETRQLAYEIMGVMAIAVIGNAIEITSITGILRGAGDTRFAFAVDASCAWLISVPMGLLAGFVWRLPVLAVFICLRTDIPIRITLCLTRILRGKYIKNVTRDISS
ncbi:MAG: MATE family efflux transporter [Oscillospiraceae bacterium]|nr:MATE family efflux transporter [Oscillospiraceae bacterium]